MARALASGRQLECHSGASDDYGAPSMASREPARLQLQTERCPKEVTELLDKLRVQRNSSAAAALRNAVLASRSLHLELWRAGDVAPFASLELSCRLRVFVVGPAAAASRRTDAALRQSPVVPCAQRRGTDAIEASLLEPEDPALRAARLPP